MTMFNPHIIVMGVSACGKSRIASAMSTALDRPFVEGDLCHPPTNITKMEQGIPLTDHDRWPWLHRVAQAINAADGPVVATCSALKRAYRDFLRREVARPVLFLHLSAPPAVLLPRMTQRQHHFMPSTLLDSQFADLEPLRQDEMGMTVDVAPPVDEVIAAAIADYREFTRRVT